MPFFVRVVSVWPVPRKFSAHPEANEYFGGRWIGGVKKLCPGDEQLAQFLSPTFAINVRRSHPKCAGIQS